MSSSTNPAAPAPRADGSEALWRPELYARLLAMEERVCSIVSARETNLSRSQLTDDLWPRLAEESARVAGQPGGLPAGAETWSDDELVGHLVKALRRDVIDFRRTMRSRTVSLDADGAGWELRMPASPSASDAAVERDQAAAWTRAVSDELGEAAARVVLMEASGARISEQQQALGVSRDRHDGIRRRLRESFDAIHARTYSAGVFVPELIRQWWFSLSGGGRAAGQLGAAIVGLAVIGGGGAAIKHEAQSAKTASPAAVSGAPAVTPVIQLGPSLIEQAASQQRQAAAQARRRARQKRVAKQRRERQRRAAAQASAGASVAAEEFSPRVRQPSAPVAPAPSAPTRQAPSTSGGSLAANEFLPSGQ